MKNKVAILAFLSVAIVCVTSLIIWNDLKTDIRELKPTLKTEKEMTNAELQKRAIESVVKDFEQGADCLIDWETGDTVVRSNLFRHGRVECNYDLKNRIVNKVIDYKARVKRAFGLH